MIKCSDVIKSKKSFVKSIIIEQIILILKLNLVPNRVLARTIQIVEYVERWRERLVGNRTLAINRSQVFCRTNVFLNKVVYWSLVYVALARVRIGELERRQRTH